MKDFFAQILTIAHGLVKSPRATLVQLGKDVRYRFRLPAQVTELEALTYQTPFILQIETTNVCNASCIFCAYPKMSRKPGFMSLSLFEKVVKDYAAMGGGPVSLTPVVGDVLLDPHLMERFRILREHPEINQISFTTNAIGLDRYSDEEVCRLLRETYCIQVSIGGLDVETYRALYGVDRFARVRQAMERLLRLNETLSRPAHITFAFRTNDPAFESRFKQQLDEYRQRGAFISHIWTYANYSGVVENDKIRNLTVLKSVGGKSRICTYGSVAMSICWDGTITACGCVDFDGSRLRIGHAEQEPLASVWAGRRRIAILQSFGSGKLVPICRDCSAYRPNTDFALPHFEGIQACQPLPLGFFHQFWGG